MAGKTPLIVTKSNKNSPGTYMMKIIPSLPRLTMTGGKINRKKMTGMSTDITLEQQRKPPFLPPLHACW